MRFLDSWAQLPPADLLAWFLPIGLMALLVFLPGRVVARVGTLGVAVALAMTPALVDPPSLRLAWIALWALLAWGVYGEPAPRRVPGRGRRTGLLETGVVGLLLGAAVLTLLVVAVARQNLPADAGRRASYGILILVLGLLHLMLRRHTVRLAIGLAMLGLGLQIIERVAAAGLLAGADGPGFSILLATTIGCALAVRAGRTRVRVAASPWVGDAHDLHD